MAKGSRRQWLSWWSKGWHTKQHIAKRIGGRVTLCGRRVPKDVERRDYPSGIGTCHRCADIAYRAGAWVPW
jgi:hypothetical protein